MELRQIAATLWKWAWLMVVATVVAAVPTWLAVRGQPTIYQTSTTLMIGSAIEDISPDYSEFYTSQQLAQTYSELIRREPILKATAAALGFESQWRSLQAQVSAALVPGTQLMEIRVTDTDPQRAKWIADEIARQLMITVEQARPQDSYRQFIEEQASDLPPKIQGAQEEIGALQAELGQTTSARQMSELQTQITALENQISRWQATFAQYQLLLGDSGANVLTVIEEAPLAWPVGRRWMMQVALAAATGLMLAVAAAFLIEYLDDTVKNPEDVTRATKLPTLGAIVTFPEAEAADGPMMAVFPKSSVAEGYRVLRTNLQFGTMDMAKSGAVLLVTSAQPAEGKTTSLVNLGISLAQAGKKVLLVDTDLRRPMLHKQFKMSKESGLTSLLLEPEADLQRVMQETGVEGLWVLPSGRVPANPAEVLGFPEMAALLERLRSRADYVLLDSPPVLNVADASILAQKADGVLMVVETGRTRTDMLRRAVALLEGVKARLLGVVLNKVSVRRAGYYDYYYYYYYSGYYTDEDGLERKRRRRHRARNPLRRLGHALAAWVEGEAAPSTTSDAQRAETMQGARVRLSVPPGGVGSGAAAVAPTLPADADALFAQGMEHYRRREWGQAREYFVRAKEIEPSRRGMDALLSELDTFLQLERAESAPSPRPKAAAAPRARRWPAVALVLVTLAVAIAALIYTGILPTPLTSTSIALGTAAEVQRHINRGHALFVTEMYEDAIESFNQALELDPDNVDALAALQEAEEYLRMEALYAEATRLIEQEQHDLAAAKLREIIEIDPWHKNAGVLLARSERYHEVDTLYEEAVGYYQAGEWAKATSAFQAVLDKDPSHGYEDLDTMLFESYLNDGRQRIANARSSLDIIEASQSFDEALEILPFDTEAQQEKGLASLYADAYSASRRSDWRRAVVALSQIYDVRPDYAGGQAADTLCEAYMGLADDHRAAGDLQLALDQYLVMLSVTECDEAVVRAKQQEILELLPQTMPTPLPESE